MGVMVPGMAMRPGAPIGPAPVRGAPSAGALAQQLQGMLVTKPGLEGRRARLDVPSLHGVDLCLDQFNLDAPVRVASQAPWAGEELAGASIAKAFWSSLRSDAESVFKHEDRSLLKQIFNPHLSDRRDEGEDFTPPDPSSEYLERLRCLVQQEEKVRQLRKEQFCSSAFAASNPGPLFPFSWTPAYEIKLEGAPQGGQLRPRPDYVAQAAMFDHVLRSATPAFDKSTEDGLRFRAYKFGSLDVRTTQEHDGKEVIGAVFSVRASEPAEGRKSVQEDERIVKVTEYVEAARQTPDALHRRSYVVLETAQGNTIVTEKRRDGTIAWEENPEDLEDRNSLAKFIRSFACGLSKKATVTVGDMEAFRSGKGKQPGASHSGCKRYAQLVYNRARGLLGRHDSGFGSKAAWHKGKFAKSTQKETRKETRRAEAMARRAEAERSAKAKAGLQKAGRKVIEPIVVGTWDDWTLGAPMTFDEVRSCWAVELQMAGGPESFQILCENDWDLCLHPSAPGKRGLCGPDAEGHNKNWTIGAHEDDSVEEGMVYRIVLRVDAQGAAEKVEWEQLGVCELEA